MKNVAQNWYHVKNEKKENKMQASQNKIIILQLFSQLIRIKSACLLGFQQSPEYFYSYFLTSVFYSVCVCGERYI